MALMPPFMQSLMGYPVLDVGLLLVPRGAGTMVGMVIVGKLVSRRVDVRWTIFTGLMLTMLSLWEMARFTTDIAAWDIVRTGLTQGLGQGFIFVPLSTVTFSSLAPRYRNADPPAPTACCSPNSPMRCATARWRTWSRSSPGPSSRPTSGVSSNCNAARPPVQHWVESVDALRRSD